MSTSSGDSHDLESSGKDHGKTAPKIWPLRVRTILLASPRKYLALKFGTDLLKALVRMFIGTVSGQDNLLDKYPPDKYPL